jgi:uncharacterized protein YndB with AHSA1/START domain
MNDKLQHATITFQRSYSAPPERVSTNSPTPVARARWSPRSNDELTYNEADLRIGGKDVFRCPKGDPTFRGETCYLGIVPNAVWFQARHLTRTVSGSLLRLRRLISSRLKTARI